MADENVQIQIGAQANTQQAQSELDRLAASLDDLMRRMEKSLNLGKQKPLIGPEEKQEWKEYESLLDSGLQKLTDRYRQLNQQLREVESHQLQLRQQGRTEEANALEERAEKLRQGRDVIIGANVPGKSSRAAKMDAEAGQIGMSDTQAGSLAGKITKGLIGGFVAANVFGRVVSFAEQGRQNYIAFSESAYRLGVPGVRGSKAIDEFANSIANSTHELNYLRSETLRAAEAYNQFASRVGDKALGEDMKAIATYSRVFAEDLTTTSSFFGQMSRYGISQAAGGTPQLAQLLAVAIKEENVGALRGQFREGFGLITQTLAQRLPAFERGEAENIIGLQRWMHSSGVPGFQGTAGAQRLAKLSRMFPLTPEGMARFRFMTHFVPKSSSPIEANLEMLEQMEGFPFENPQLLVNMFDSTRRFGKSDASRIMALYQYLGTAGFSMHETEALYRNYKRGGGAALTQSLGAMRESHSESFSMDRVQLESNATANREYYQTRERELLKLGEAAQRFYDAVEKFTGSALAAEAAGGALKGVGQGLIGGLLANTLEKTMASIFAPELKTKLGQWKWLAKKGLGRSALGSRAADFASAAWGEGIMGALGAETLGGALAASPLATVGLAAGTAVTFYELGQQIYKGFIEEQQEQHYDEQSAEISRQGREAHAYWQGQHDEKVNQAFQDPNSSYLKDVFNDVGTAIKDNDLKALTREYKDFEQHGALRTLEKYLTKQEIKIVIDYEGNVKRIERRSDKGYGPPDMTFEVGGSHIVEGE